LSDHSQYPVLRTGQQDDIEFYLKRPRVVGDLHGQAPVLWLIAHQLKP